MTKDGLVAIDPMKTAFDNIAVGGTPGWASPEQTLGEVVNDKSDVYTIGLLLALFSRAII